ncbi:nucleotide exchange factor GrpE [Halolamina sp.]|jgi:Molecular chaperone GrpE (heat shock protein)|uniref:nucleotide exchange factor GrpE n=1 Tax=Halolamina sp. TaxID=1940283 RepID=UPI003566E6AA
MTEEADGAHATEETGTTPETEEAATAADTTADAESAAGSEHPLVERVAAHDEALAGDLKAELTHAEAELTKKEEQIEDLEGTLKRKQADFQNFKKRQEKKLADQTARATEDLVERLLPVRDNLARALEQGSDTDISDGVEGTLRELDSVLEDEGVETIQPELGADPDPERHEVMMRVESDQPAGTIAKLYRPGYEMADRIIRTAQVTVSTGE